MSAMIKPIKKKATPSFLGGLFSPKKAPEKKGSSLFGKDDEDDKLPSFYGKTDDDGDSFNSSYYEEKSSKKREVKERQRLEFLRYLTWMEYAVVAVELFLIIYTILVLLGIVPIF